MAKRIPNRAARQGLAPREPRGELLAYRKRLRQLLTRVEAIIGRELLPVLGEVARQDTLSRVVTERLDKVEVAVGQVIADADFDGFFGQQLGERMRKKSFREAKRVIGITDEIGMQPLIDSFRTRNVLLIKSLVGDEIGQIRTLLRDSGGALRVEALSKQIQGRFGVARSRANLIARDQTLTLNAQMARQRQQNAGVAEYIWTTSGDEAVRDAHADLEGTRHRWDTPPVMSDDGRTGHPGDDYQCRCTAFPVIPELGPELAAPTLPERPKLRQPPTVVRRGRRRPKLSRRGAPLPRRRLGPRRKVIETKPSDLAAISAKHWNAQARGDRMRAKPSEFHEGRYSPAARKSVEQWIWPDYSSIRAVEKFPSSHGLSAEVARRARESSKGISDAFRTVPKTSGTFYRGLHAVSETQLKTMLGKSTMQLGATTSTSWDYLQAVKFARKGITGPRDGQAGYSVILRMRSKRGLPIEKLGRYPGQREVLLEKGSKYSVVGKQWIEGAHRNLVVLDLEELPL